MFLALSECHLVLIVHFGAQLVLLICMSFTEHYHHEYTIDRI
jgi:hypothetical protein